MYVYCRLYYRHQHSDFARQNQDVTICRSSTQLRFDLNATSKPSLLLGFFVLNPQLSATAQPKPCGTMLNWVGIPQPQTRH